MSVYADCRESFRMLARIASKSIADPPWFAMPVNAQEDQDSLTVYFHVPGKNLRHLRVQAGDETVTVREAQERGRRTPTRLCALPCRVVGNQIEATQVGDLLRIRMPKKRPAVDSRETPPGT